MDQRVVGNFDPQTGQPFAEGGPGQDQTSGDRMRMTNLLAGHSDPSGLGMGSSMGMMDPSTWGQAQMSMADQQAWAAQAAAASQGMPGMGNDQAAIFRWQQAMMAQHPGFAAQAAQGQAGMDPRMMQQAFAIRQQQAAAMQQYQAAMIAQMYQAQAAMMQSQQQQQQVAQLARPASVTTPSGQGRPSISASPSTTSPVDTTPNVAVQNVVSFPGQVMQPTQQDATQSFVLPSPAGVEAAQSAVMPMMGMEGVMDPGMAVAAAAISNMTPEQAQETQQRLAALIQTMQSGANPQATMEQMQHMSAQFLQLIQASSQDPTRGVRAFGVEREKRSLRGARDADTWPPAPPAGWIPGTQDLSWRLAAKLILHEMQKPMSSQEIVEAIWERGYRTKPNPPNYKEARAQLSSGLVSDLRKWGDQGQIVVWKKESDGTNVWGLREFISKGMTPFIPVNGTQGLPLLDAIVQVLRTRKEFLKARTIIEEFERSGLRVNMPIDQMPVKSLKDCVAKEVEERREHSIFVVVGQGKKMTFGLKEWENDPEFIQKKRESVPQTSAAQAAARAQQQAQSQQAQQTQLPMTHETISKMHSYLIDVIDHYLKAEETAKTTEQTAIAQQCQILAISLMQMLTSCQQQMNVFRVVKPDEAASSSSTAVPQTPDLSKVFSTPAGVGIAVGGTEQGFTNLARLAEEMGRQQPSTTTDIQSVAAPATTSAQNAGMVLDFSGAEQGNAAAPASTVESTANSGVQLVLSETSNANPQEGQPQDHQESLQPQLTQTQLEKAPEVPTEGSQAVVAPSGEVAPSADGPQQTPQQQPTLSSYIRSLMTDLPLMSSEQLDGLQKSLTEQTYAMVLQYSQQIRSTQPEPVPFLEALFKQMQTVGMSAFSAAYGVSYPQAMAGGAATPAQIPSTPGVGGPVDQANLSSLFATPGSQRRGRPRKNPNNVPATLAKPFTPSLIAQTPGGAVNAQIPTAAVATAAPQTPSAALFSMASQQQQQTPVQVQQVGQQQQPVVGMSTPSAAVAAATTMMVPPVTMEPEQSQAAVADPVWPPAMPTPGSQSATWISAAKWVLYENRRPMTESEILQTVFAQGWKKPTTQERSVRSLHEALYGYLRKHGDMARLSLIGRNPQGQWMWICSEFVPPGLQKLPDGTFDMQQFTAAYYKRYYETLQQAQAQIQQASATGTPVPASTDFNASSPVAAVPAAAATALPTAVSSQPIAQGPTMIPNSAAPQNETSSVSIQHIIAGGIGQLPQPIANVVATAPATAPINGGQRKRKLGEDGQDNSGGEDDGEQYLVSSGDEADGSSRKRQRADQQQQHQSVVQAKRNEPSPASYSMVTAEGPGSKPGKFTVRLVNTSYPRQLVELTGSEDVSIVEKTIKVALGIPKEQEFIMKKAGSSSIVVLNPKISGDFDVYVM